MESLKIWANANCRCLTKRKEGSNNFIEFAVCASVDSGVLKGI